MFRRTGRSRRFEDFFADVGGGEQEPHIGFTKRMAALVCAEEAAVVASKPAMADRLARVLMGGCDHVKQLGDAASGSMARTGRR